MVLPIYTVKGSIGNWWAAVEQYGWRDLPCLHVEFMSSKRCQSGDTYCQHLPRSVGRLERKRELAEDIANYRVVIMRFANLGCPPGKRWKMSGYIGLFRATNVVFSEADDLLTFKLGNKIANLVTPSRA